MNTEHRHLRNTATLNVYSSTTILRMATANGSTAAVTASLEVPPLA